MPRIDGSISDQSSFEAASTVSISGFSSGSAVASSNNPPLNQSTVSKPTKPPLAMPWKSAPDRIGRWRFIYTMDERIVWLI